MKSQNIQTLSNFLKGNVRQDLKIVALNEILALSGSEEGYLIFEGSEIEKQLLECLSDNNEAINKTACLSLVNISATDKGCQNIFNACPNADKQELFSKLMKHVTDPESSAADAACMTLSNLTRQNDIVTLFVNYLFEANIKIEEMIEIFNNINYNKKDCNLNHLGFLFSNLSQNHKFRRCLLDKDRCLIKKLIPFIKCEDSSVRKCGIVGTLKNCCFETDYHQWLLESDVDILPHLLLPLAGPEVFDEEDNDKLPLDLQYLEEDKKREPDGNVRKMLLESLLQLCATKLGREYFRSKNAYIILREYHKWEKDRSILLICENIVDILIRTEEEIDKDNLKEVEVPEQYVKKFNEMDKEFVEND